MKHYFIAILFLTFVSYSFGQTPSATPTPVPSVSPEKTRTKNFGSSLKKYEKKKHQSDSQNKQKRDADNYEETIQVKTDLVMSDVLVVNQKGNAVLGLQQNDFIVAEDGTPQKISVFAFGENATIPRSIVLIIDYSGSQFPFIKNSVEAAKKLVDKLAPQDRMAIVTDDVKLLVGFTKDKSLLKNELDELGKKAYTQVKGRSKQYTALMATLNELFEGEHIRPIVIFQTDGDELFSLKTGEKMPPSVLGKFTKELYSFEDVRELVSKSRAIIYSIIPGFRLLGLSHEEQFAKIESMSKTLSKVPNVLREPFKVRKLSREEFDSTPNLHLNQQSALFEIAQLSGGYTDFIENPEDAENVYSNIFTVINNRYVIGYYPANEERNGKRRNVKIEVKGHPEYTIMGRKTYFASEEKE